MSRLAIALVTLAIAHPVFAQSPPASRATTRFGALRQEGDPYRKLFAATPALKPSTAEARPAKKIVCGLTMIEGDPSIDPKMAKAFPKKDGVAHTIRSIEPPVCKP
jgi:hypothetical protein